MVPAADNDFKYKSYQKGGKTNVANKVSIHDPKHREALLVKGMTIGSKQCLDMILIILETPERVSLVGISGGNNYNYNMELATQLHKLACTKMLMLIKQPNRRKKPGNDRKRKYAPSK